VRRVAYTLDRIANALTVVGCSLLAWLVLSAHVGTNLVVLEGNAGGYPIRVMIDPPGVVPAQVPILVRVLAGTPTRVTVRAAQWNVGTKGAPPAEEAAIVPGAAGEWSHDLWIMTASTYAVYVAVEGPAGNGALVVPLQTSATRTLGMKQGMSAVLLVLGTLLVAGLLTIVGAATREGSLVAGERPTAARQRTARIATASTAGLLALALFGGSKWWQAEERDYKRRMFKPIRLTASIKAVDSERMLTIAVTDPAWLEKRFPPLMPDHGKLMHLFLIAQNDQRAIAHLHPLRISADSFVTRVPALPEGRYLMFGDVMFQNGAQRTMVDTVDMPVAPVVAGEVALPAGVIAPDPDDAWRVVNPAALGGVAPLSSGGSITLAADGAPLPLAAGRDVRLVVSVRDANGNASVLEPYMGMSGHAMVLRKDAGVFMHIHPMGTASMTAQAQLKRRERGDTAMLDSASIAVAIENAEHGEMSGPGAHGMQMSTDRAAALAFPFVFPSAGDYRVFVQVKRNGVVETTAFDVTINASDSARR